MRLVVASVIVLALAACGSKPAESSPPPPAVAPTLTCSVAEGATNVTPGASTLTLTADEAIDPATVTADNITLSALGEGTPLTFAVSSDGLTITVSAALAEHRHYTLFVSGVKATAALGGLKMKANLQVHFATVGGPAVIIATTPQDMTNGVAVDAHPTLTFSESVVDATPSAIQLLQGGQPVDATVSFDAMGKVASIVPTQALSGHGTYTVTVGAGLTDADDQLPLAGAPKTVLTFTTASIAPLIRDVEPPDQSMMIAVDTHFTLSFSRPMNGDTLNSSNITLTAVGGSAVATTITLASNQEDVTIVPNASLALGQGYLLEVTTRVTDASNIPLTDPHTYHYATPPPLPMVASVDPIDGATDVSITKAIRVTFNTPVDYTGVTETTFQITPTAGGSALPGLVAAEHTGLAATFYVGGDTNEFLTLTDYTVTLSNAIVDTHGQHLAAFTSHFTTQEEPAPVPTFGCHGVSGGTDCLDFAGVDISFSRPVQGVSATTCYITAMGSSTPVAITPTLAGPLIGQGLASSATLTPPMGAALMDGTMYTVTLTAGITNAHGVALAPTTWTFTAVPPMM